MQSQASGGALRAGMIAGILVGIMSLPIVALSVAGNAIGAPIGLLRVGFLVVATVAFVVAGFTASKRSGLMRSGVWAGTLGALLSAFILICVGAVIVILSGPHAAAVAHASRAAGRALRVLMRVAIGRLVIAGLITLGCGLVAGLIGGALGRLTHPRSSAPTAASMDTLPTQAYAAQTPPPPAMHDYAAVYTPDPAQPMTPVYDDASPTVERDYQG